MNTVEPRSGHDFHEIIQILFLLEWDEPDGIYIDGFGFHKQWADGFWIMDFSFIFYLYGFFTDFKSIWIMAFLRNGYGFKILKNMDFGKEMDLVSNPPGLTD